MNDLFAYAVIAAALIGSVVLIFRIYILLRWYTTKLIPKDPEDYSHTRNSTVWVNDSYCNACKSTTGFEERVSSRCFTCGSQSGTTRLRSRRMIWNGEEWVHQIAYDGSYWRYVIVERKEIKHLDPQLR